MKRIAALLVALLVFGAVKYPIEKSITDAHHAAYFHGAALNLTLREQIGQGAFLAALSGFRGVIADVLTIRANIAWQNGQWSRLLLLYNQIGTLQPRLTLGWEMGAWYLAFDASKAALDDPTQPREALRIVQRVARETNLCAMELVEVAPCYDISDMTSLMATRVIVDVIANMVHAGKLPRNKPSWLNSEPSTEPWAL